jgi:hypothetical protein
MQQVSVLGGRRRHSSSSNVATTDARVAEMRGRFMPGWLRVDSTHLSTDRELVKSVELGTALARSPARQMNNLV